MPRSSSTKATREYPALPAAGNSVESHSAFLRQLKENVEIHERRTPNIGASFIRVKDLIDLGIIKVRGTQLVLGDEQESSSSSGGSSGGGGVSDHGALSGLLDDDHTQYVLRSLLTADGDIFIRSGGVISRLAVGSDGQVLTVASSLPSWADASGGGGVVVPIAPFNFPALALEILADSPDAFWEFDEDFQGGTAVDSSGNGEDITVSTVASDFSQGVPFGFGSQQQCLYVLPGATSGDAVGASAVGTPPWNGGVTLEFVVNLLEDGTGPYTLFEHAVSGETEATNVQAAIYVSAEGVPQYLHEYSGGSDERHDFDVRLPRCIPLHLMFVKDSSTKTVTLYVNGVAMDSITYTNEVTGGGSGLPRFGEGLGDGGDGSEYHLQSFCAIYTTQALSAERVSAHFDAWMTPDTSDIDVIGYTPDQYPGTPDDADDEFTFGSGLDTTGSRFSGAEAWSWMNQGSVVDSIEQENYLALTMPQESGENVRAAFQAAPATPWVYRAKLAMNLAPANFHQGGIYLRDSATGEIVHLGFEAAGAYVNGRKQVTYWNSATSYSSTPYSGSGLAEDMVRDWYYFEVEDDNTNIYYRLSRTGVEGSFVEVYSASRTAFLTNGPDEIGIGGAVNNASAGGNVIFADWFRRIS